MNRADRMLVVLGDGRPHSRREIFDRAGFMLTNNAASELRAQGHDVRQWREKGVYFYRLVALSEEAREGHGAGGNAGTPPKARGDFPPCPASSLSVTVPDLLTVGAADGGAQLQLVPPENGAYKREAA